MPVPRRRRRPSPPRARGAPRAPAARARRQPSSREPSPCGDASGSRSWNALRTRFPRGVAHAHRGDISEDDPSVGSAGRGPARMAARPGEGIPVSALTDLSRELADLASRGAAGVVGIEHRAGHGSGLVLAEDGYILTNSHVLQATQGLRVRLPGAAVADARVVGA